MLVSKAIAFVRRDFIIHASYKFAFVFELLTTVFPVLSFYFVAKLVKGANVESLHQYGGEYFPFVLVGIAFTQYFMLALSSFATTIRRSQMAGCLEAMLSTRTHSATIIVLSSLYAFGVKLGHMLVAFTLAGVVLGVDYSRANFVSAGVVLLLTVLAFSGFGILSAAIIVVLKKGDPIEWIFGSLCSLLGGALFPVAVMPGWLQKIAALLPMTHSLEAARLAILRGESLVRLWPQLVILGGMAALLLPTSIVLFSKAVEKGRRDGGLMHY